MSSKYAHSGGEFTAIRHSTSYDYISPLKLNFTGAHVIVTGAAWEDGVGFATALGYARGGASVIVVADLLGVSEQSLAKLKQAATEAGRKEPRVIGHKVDIADLASVQALHDALEPDLSGRLDILVNNAAYQEPGKPFLELDQATYWKPYEINVRGLFNMARIFLPILLATRKADPTALCTMINVASSGALSARPNSGSYRTSKLAVVRWTESLQLEYADAGLVTLCVNPGAIKTKMTENLSEEIRNRLPDRPDVAGDTIVWLSHVRRDWLGGRYVSCPWDMEELVGKEKEIVEKDLLKMRMAF
jgi:NAD(P)-dependent dehydrogenase (short-subunit alcohol dehydrogenase family)